MTTNAISFSVTVQRRDGSTVTHTAQFVRYVQEADGIIAVEAICDGDELTRSRHTLPFDLAGISDADLVAEIQAHVQRVAQGHAARQRAGDLLASLVPPAAQTAPQPKPAPQLPAPGSTS